MSTMRATAIGALAIGTLLAASAVAPAWADRDGWHRGWGGGHERWEHRRWGRPMVVYAPPPPVYYRPPPVYYAPPPVYYAPPAYVAPGVSVGIGFNLR
ncbi:MAG: hypothetical protein ABS99_06675 [Acetobacteraceae bacterium SCN 69-10]|nr:MAG: hypothetical protein ABS99_06675 [Acetobacteraceae bacterium SCN 69-10]OJY64990.1 MAG: hypothetical protein BGP12_04500 [Rhodospirillales bacterium 70-18]